MSICRFGRDFAMIHVQKCHRCKNFDLSKEGCLFYLNQAIIDQNVEIVQGLLNHLTLGMQTPTAE